MSLWLCTKCKRTLVFSAIIGSSCPSCSGPIERIEKFGPIETMLPCLDCQEVKVQIGQAYCDECFEKRSEKKYSINDMVNVFIAARTSIKSGHKYDTFGDYKKAVLEKRNE